MAENGFSEEEAIAYVQDPMFIVVQLFFDRLDHILADRWATEALRQLLIEDRRETLEAIKDFLSRVQIEVREAYKTRSKGKRRRIQRAGDSAPETRRQDQRRNRQNTPHEANDCCSRVQQHH
jgi:hypothetical protein